MFVTEQQSAPQQPGGYEPRQPTPQEIMGLALVIPPDVALAMRFIEICNDHTKAKPFIYTDGQDGLIEAFLHEPELHPFQEAAFRRACIRLGRFFDGAGPRKQRPQ